MKVYIYIDTNNVIFLNGMIADIDRANQMQIEYFESQQKGAIMISLDIDTFIFLEDNGAIYKSELIIN